MGQVSQSHAPFDFAKNANWRNGAANLCCYHRGRPTISHSFLQGASPEMKRRELSHIRSHSFRGRRYEVIWRKPRPNGICENCGQPTCHDSDGECDPPDNKFKRLKIGPRLPEPELLETAIHEVLHACVWDLSEQSIDETSRDLAKFLRRIGFRLE